MRPRSRPRGPRGHRSVEPGPKEPRQRRALGRGDLEDHDPPPRLGHARHLVQPAVEIGEVARAETDGDRVELSVAVGQIEGVALHPFDLRGLASRQVEHALGEIEAHHGRSAPGQLDGQVAGARGHVEGPRAGADLRAIHGPLAPAVVHARGHHGVHAVVDTGDAVEHHAYLCLGHGAGRGGAAAHGLGGLLALQRGHVLN